MGYTFDTFPSGTYPQVNTYADLPTSPVPGDIYAVLNSSGIWPINYHASGLYRWTGTAWVKFDDLQEILNNQTLTDINGPLVGVGGVITTGSVGVTDHSLLSNLDYISSGHVGFQPTSQITKNITYNLDGTVNVITDAMGTKTMAYNLDGTLASITGTGVYVTKTFTYAGGVLTDITVS